MADALTIVLIVLFFLISILIGWFASRKEDAEGFLIANRKLGLFESVMTLSGTFVGAMTLLVYTAFVFTFGISALWIFIGYFLGFVIFSFFAVHLYKSSKGKNFYTMADYFRFRFGKKTALLVISVIFIWYFGTLSAQFIGGGKVLNELTGLSFSVSAMLMALVILIYLVLGGFRSVVKTDIFQFIVMGMILSVMAVMLKSGLQVPIQHFNPFNAGAVNIVAFLLLGILTPFAAQDYWQRIFAMKDETVVKKSFIISGFLVFAVSFILTYIGLVARASFGDIDADLAVLYAFTHLVPDFMAGFVAIAFFAAILSTADTFLFLLSVNFTNDIIDMRRATPKKSVKATRLAILGIGILALALALIYPNIVDITIIFKSLGLIISPIVLIAWLSEGNKAAIVSTIIVTASAVLILSALGFVRPELGFVGMIGGFIVYGLSLLVLKMKNRILKIFA